MTSIKFKDAKRLLDRYCMAVYGKLASTNKKPSKNRNEEGKKEAWWLENTGNNHEKPGLRALAYLKAYDEIACLGGTLFYATGIPLMEGFMWPDRGVMKTLLKASYVSLDEKKGLFTITGEGHDAIGQIDKIEPG
jgi:hypothetical protein